jgi:CheY-like chemotaxis protein
MLRREGYGVVEASDGVEALQVSGEHADPIDLLLTDIIMPGMNGYQLAAQLRENRPELKVLYMSGYQDRVIADITGVSVECSPLIRKPFTQYSLATKIAEILAQSAHPAASGK